MDAMTVVLAVAAFVLAAVLGLAVWYGCWMELAARRQLIRRRMERHERRRAA